MQWRQVRAASAPEVATPRVVSRTFGIFYIAGGSVGLLSATAVPGRSRLGDLIGIALCLAAVGLGALLVRWGARLPRWCFHLAQAQAIVMIAVDGHVASSGATAAGVVSVGTFVAVDAFFFFAWPAAVGQLAALVVLVGAAQLTRPGSALGPVCATSLVFLTVAAVVYGLVQRASNASLDSLTGLANRRGFDERLADAVTTARRTGAPLSVALLDVDRFKTVNDTRGHAAGDLLLRDLATGLGAIVPAGALLARHGGDEFALLAPDLDLDAALALAERLRAAAGTTGLSTGVAQLAVGEGASTLVRRADAALYDAKAAGRGRSVAHRADDCDLAHDLAAAIAAEAIDVALQPVVDPADGTVVGVEALARWTHPERGPVSPGVFVPVAEGAGLVAALGMVVLRRACADAVRLRDALGQDLLLTVNASGHQLVDPGFAEDVATVLTATGWQPAQLVVEVTESAFEATTSEARATLELLRAHGIAVAIDDFGTGYSAFSQLDSLPADYLKLDATFIATTTTSHRRTAMLTALLGLARDLDLAVIAEGVELPEQAQLLAESGCPLAQGYLFARPMGVDALVEHLTGRPSPAAGVRRPVTHPR